MKRAIIILLLLVLSFSGCTVKESVDTYSGEIYFGMTEKELTDLKGEPVEKGDLDSDDYLCLTYEENIEGYSAKTYYTFSKSDNNWELDELAAAIPTSVEERKQVFDDIYAKLTAHYENKENYYNDGIETDDDGTLSAHFGITDGATDIDVVVWSDDEYVHFIIVN